MTDNAFEFYNTSGGEVCYYASVSLKMDKITHAASPK